MCSSVLCVHQNYFNEKIFATRHLFHIFSWYSLCSLRKFLLPKKSWSKVGPSLVDPICHAVRLSEPNCVIRTNHVQMSKIRLVRKWVIQGEGLLYVLYKVLYNFFLDLINILTFMLTCYTNTSHKIQYRCTEDVFKFYIKWSVFPDSYLLRLYWNANLWFFLVYVKRTNKWLLLCIVS